MTKNEASTEAKYPYADEAMAWMDERIAGQREYYIIEKDMVDAPGQTVQWWTWYLERRWDLPQNHLDTLEQMRKQICADCAKEMLSTSSHDYHPTGDLTDAKRLGKLSDAEYFLERLEEAVFKSNPDWEVHYERYIGRLAELLKQVTGQSDAASECQNWFYLMQRRVAMTADEKVQTIKAWQDKVAELEVGIAAPSAETDTTIVGLWKVYYDWTRDCYEHTMDGVYSDAGYIARHGLAAHEALEAQGWPTKSLSNKN